MKSMNIPAGMLEPLPPEPEEDVRAFTGCAEPTKDYWYEAGNHIRYVRKCEVCAIEAKARIGFFFEMKPETAPKARFKCFKKEPKP